MRRVLLAALAALSLLAGSGTGTADAAGEYVRDLDLLSACYQYFGPSTGCSQGNAAVRFNLSIRAHSATVNSAITRVDAAARGYDFGDPNVRNVQVEKVQLLDTNDTLKSGPSGAANSNGGPMTALLTVPGCTVGAGTGAYKALVTVSWSEINNVVHRQTLNVVSDNRSFRTLSCP